MTRILSLPLLAATVVTANNETWIDSLSFALTTAAVSYAETTNRGTGGIGSITTTESAPLGNSIVRVTAVDTVTVFTLTNPDGVVIAGGEAGVPFNRSGFSFTLHEGNIPFAVGDSFVILTMGAPTDISDIDFSLVIREAAGNPNIVMTLTSSSPLPSGALVNSGIGGTLEIFVPKHVMKTITPGDYVFDVLATADGNERRVIIGSLSVSQGINP